MCYCVYHRGKQPWEASDGAVFLLREMAGVVPGAVQGFMTGVADLSRLATFQHAYNLHETIWASLPVIAAALGNKAFKPYLELFLPSMFADLKCGHQLAEAAAGRCIGRLRDWLGPKIFAGRLDDAQREALDSDANIPPSVGLMGGSRRPGAIAAAATGIVGPAGPGVAPWAANIERQTM